MRGICDVPASRFEESAMSFSVSASNTSNPFASLQSLWQQASPASGTQTPSSDPLSGLLAGLDQQVAGGPSSTSGATSSGGTATAPTGLSQQFDPQTLQALLALQTSGGANPQSTASQAANAASGADPFSAQQSQPSQGQHGHHHHHHMGSGDSTQSTANAASGDSTPSDTSGSSAGGGAVTGNNLIGQLMQMQAQLVTPAPSQIVTTA
jgi:hypothetical protein